jgi:hypothetical protein
MCATAAELAPVAALILQSAGLRHISGSVRDGFGALFGAFGGMAVIGHNRRLWPFAEIRLDSVSYDSLAFDTPWGGQGCACPFAVQQGVHDIRRSVRERFAASFAGPASV